MGNPILGDQAEEIVKAARKQREVDVGLKFGRKVRSKFLERKNSGTLQRVENVNGSGGGGSGDSGSSGTGGSDGNDPPSPTTATPMPIPKEAVTGGGEDEEAALKKLKEKKKAERIAKHTAMIEKKKNGELSRSR